jgi:hypothetical protein
MSATLEALEKQLPIAEKELAEAKEANKPDEKDGPINKMRKEQNIARDATTVKDIKEAIAAKKKTEGGRRRTRRHRGTKKHTRRHRKHRR